MQAGRSCLKRFSYSVLPHLGGGDIFTIIILPVKVSQKFRKAKIFMKVNLPLKEVHPYSFFALISVSKYFTNKTQS